jgi:hypothetical protein
MPCEKHSTHEVTEDTKLSELMELAEECTSRVHAVLSEYSLITAAEAVENVRREVRRQQDMHARGECPECQPPLAKPIEDALRDALTRGEDDRDGAA